MRTVRRKSYKLHEAIAQSEHEQDVVFGFNDELDTTIKNVKEIIARSKVKKLSVEQMEILSDAMMSFNDVVYTCLYE